MEKEVVAVHVEQSEDGFRRITCVIEDKSYIFELENNPYLMTSGKVAEFFNFNQEPTKVRINNFVSVFCLKYKILFDFKGYISLTCTNDNRKTNTYFALKNKKKKKNYDK